MSTKVKVSEYEECSDSNSDENDEQSKIMSNLVGKKRNRESNLTIKALQKVCKIFEGGKRLKADAYEQLKHDTPHLLDLD